jgi:signal transduction histidine kinase
MATAPEFDVREFEGGRLFDAVPSWIAVLDRNLRLVAANKKLAEDFGDRRGENCFAVYKGRGAPCPECPVMRTFEDGKDHTSEEKVFDRRGLPHDVVVNSRPLRDAGGQIVAVMELFTEITVQKELANRLHESLVRFQNLFDLVPCYISVHDREFRIIEANQRFKETFGGRPGAYCYQVYKKRAEQCATCPVADTFRDGAMHSGEEVMTDDAGRQIHVVVHTAPVRDSAGNITAVIKVLDDVTEIRMLQDKLASLGGLVGSIAHSVKNILEGLRGGVYIVNLGFRNNNQEDVRTGWEMVERNVGRVSGLIMDMLYCARERSPRRVPVSLPAVVGEVIELFLPRTRSVGIALQARVSEDINTIPAEPKDIHSLISNLVANAIDACCSDQNEQKEHRVVVRVFRDAAGAVIEVEDNGAGIDEETRGKLFTVFFSTKGTFGTGLGLLVSHKVATEHGGSISVKSTAGEGSVFTVRLPGG